MSESGAAPASILVVDDDAGVAGLIFELLAGEDYSVQRAINGREALKMVQDRLPDLIITDLVMPEVDGLEFIAALRRIDMRMPIIAISGGGLVDKRTYLSLAGKMGANAILAKPFANDDLVRKVGELLHAHN
jgi:CheY-like chemotaxis protein